MIYQNLGNVSRMKQIAQVGNQAGRGHVQVDYPAVGNTRRGSRPLAQNPLGANVADGADSVPTKAGTWT